MIPALKDGKEFEDLKVVLENLDFESNFTAKIRTIKDIPATSEFSVPHGLGKTPTMRIVVRQSDGGYITDGATQWNEKSIYLYNSGAAIRQLTILILR